MLTANLTDDSIIACATQLQDGAQSLGVEHSVKSLSSAVKECSTAFRGNAVSNFMVMIRLIQLKSTISR